MWCDGEPVYIEWTDCKEERSGMLLVDEVSLKVRCRNRISHIEKNGL